MNEQLWTPIEGRFGRTRKGDRVGPFTSRMPGVSGRWSDGIRVWHGDGKYGGGAEFDLVAEWVGEPAHEGPVDLSQIKARDRVRLGGEFEVTSTANGGLWLSFPTRGERRWVPAEAVLAHISVPHQISIGCKVRITRSSYPDCEFEVLGILSEEAWIKDCKHGDTRVEDLSGLTLIGQRV